MTLQKEGKGQAYSASFGIYFEAQQKQLLAGLYSAPLRKQMFRITFTKKKELYIVYGPDHRN